MTKFSLPFLFGLILLYRSQAQAVLNSEISGSGDLSDTENDPDTDEGSGVPMSMSLVTRPTPSTPKPFRVGSSTILPDDEDDDDEYVMMPEGEGSATGGGNNVVTEKTTATMQTGGSGSLVQCTSDGMWCWCLDEYGNEMTGTMRKFGRAELELTNCSPSAVSAETVPTTKTTTTTTTKSPTTTTEATTAGLPERMVCSSSGLYCWCLDLYGNEIHGTRMYMFNTKLSPYVTCPPGETTVAVSTVKEIEITTPATGGLLPERMVCNEDGRYCWCLDFYGNEIPGTRIYMSGTVLSPSVQCPLGEPNVDANVGATNAMQFTTPVIDWQHVNLPDWMACDSLGLSCWCLDEDGNEIPGSRMYRFGGGPTAGPDKSCLTGVTANRDPSTVPTDTDITLVVEETTTIKSKKTTPYEPPYDVHIEDVYPKTEKPIVPAEPSDDKEKEDKIGQGAGKGGRNGVDKTDISTSYPFFTHPGILAAIIGGGVVALLSAMLLIMFIVYRMRKKDEGSYPLDPDSKPPRLHTYTRAPNKEFYA